MNNEDIDKNFVDFVEKHGIEGFFQLYIREFLLEVFKTSIQSRSSDIDSDVAYQYYFNENGEMKSPDELKKFNLAVEKRVDELTEKLMDSLRKSDFFAEMKGKLNIQTISPEKNKTLQKLLQESLKEIIGTKWGRYIH